MPYLVERKQAIRLRDLVVVVPLAKRRARSRLILRDNSLHETLTRPGTLRRNLDAAAAGRISGVSTQDKE